MAITCSWEAEKNCRSEYHWEDGVPYCDECGLFRQSVAAQKDLPPQKRNTSPHTARQDADTWKRLYKIWRGYYVEATQRGMLMAQENAALREENARLLVENSRLRQDVAWYKHLGESGR